MLTRHTSQGTYRHISGRLELAAAAIVGAALIAGCGGGSSGGKVNPSTTLSAAIKLQQSGQLDAATQLYKQVLAAQPSNYYAHYDIGDIEQKQGQTALALNEYGDALAANPTFVPALYNEGVIFTPTDPQLAISLFRKVIAIDATQSTAQLNLGILELHNGERAQGVKDLAAATKADPSLARLVPASVRHKVAKAGKTAKSGGPSPTPTAVITPLPTTPATTPIH